MKHWSMIGRTVACSVAVIGFAVAGGCSSSVSMSDWQKAFQRHLANEAQGDASFLRQADVDGHHRFAVLGHALPEKSTDVSGAFLGRRKVNGGSWLVFLAASIRQGEIEDIRLALYSDTTANTRWIISEPNELALTAYRNTKTAHWKRAHAVRLTPPADAGLFPPEGDQFRMTIAGNTASALHEPSGARWTVVVAE